MEPEAQQQQDHQQLTEVPADNSLTTTTTTTTTVLVVVRSRHCSGEDATMAVVEPPGIVVQQLTRTSSPIDILTDLLEPQQPSNLTMGQPSNSSEINSTTDHHLFHQIKTNIVINESGAVDEPVVVIVPESSASPTPPPLVRSQPEELTAITTGTNSERMDTASKQPKQAAEEAAKSSSSSNSKPPPHQRFVTASRSFFARLRNRLKPIGPCQALHLVPASSSSATITSGSLKTSNNNKPAAEEVFIPPTSNCPRQQLMVRSKGELNRSVSARTYQQHQQQPLPPSPPHQHLRPAKKSTTTTTTATTANQALPPVEQVTVIEFTSHPLNQEAVQSHHQQTTVEINQQQLPLDQSLSNTCLLPGTTSHSSGFFSSSPSFNSTNQPFCGRSVQTPSSFSPTADDLSTSYYQRKPQQHCHHQQRFVSPQASVTVNNSLPTSRSCPFPEALAEEEAAAAAKTSKKKSSAKKPPPLVKFNELGDISPTVIQRQQQIAAAETINRRQVPISYSSTQPLSQFQSNQQPPPSQPSESFFRQNRLFRSFIKSSNKKRQGGIVSKVPQSTTMPSLRDSRGYESDDGMESSPVRLRQKRPRRANSLGTLILGFLRRRSIRLPGSRNSSPHHPRVASPVGPRMSPDGRRRSRAGYHCEVPDCHCHIFPEAYSTSPRLGGTVPHRPHLQRSQLRQSLPPSSRPASYHATTTNDNSLELHLPPPPQQQESLDNEPVGPIFLRGYGPTAPDDPAPQFHRHRMEASLSPLDSDGFYDDDELIVSPGPHKMTSSATSSRPPVKVLTSTPYQKTTSPFCEKKFMAVDFSQHQQQQQNFNRGTAKYSTMKTVSFNKPPPIVSFIKEGSEEDLLYRDGDLIQIMSISNGFHEPLEIEVPTPILTESFEVADTLALVQLSKNLELKRRTLLFPSCPESPPVQRMPVVFLPAYPQRSNFGRGSAFQSSYTSSKTSSQRSHEKQLSAAAAAPTTIVYRKQVMTPLRT